MNDLAQRLSWFKSSILPHQGALRARLRRMLSADADLDDIVSESLARAYAADDWARISNGKHYLFRIARNILIDDARRNAVVSFDYVADIESLQVDCSTEMGLSARDELRHVQHAIDGLPPQCRRVFLRRRVHELSLGEIAGEMGLSVSTVEKHLAKAVMLLAKAMSEIEECSFERERRGSERSADAGRGGGISLR
ncbi:RNA polymerase sigma factor [Sphingomonas sp. YR710]|uniref:RNA polymerase sigma factor n=1 Tax=Sphingomonas sp. YR710 TaxID=1882773 RepID=UPI000B841550|nr:RNA polymerase sigma factor [Sphingomonas sp. YR710]